MEEFEGVNIKNEGNIVFIECDGVKFEFDENTEFCAEGNFYRINVLGDAPMPKILSSDRLILPIGDGVALKADGEYPPCHYSLDKISSRFWKYEGNVAMLIVERNGKYMTVIVDNALGAEYSAEKRNGIYNLSLKCTERCVVTYTVFGSVTEACKYYRSTRKTEFIPLSEKIKGNREINKLVGGAIFWIWNDRYDDVMYSDKETYVNPAVGDDIMRIAGELHSNGVDKAMFSMFFDSDSVYAEPLYKEYGYISTQYDNYTDVVSPSLLDIIPKNRVRNCGYTARRIKDYPDGIAMSESGELGKAWELKGVDGKMHAQYSLCPAVAAKRMKEEIADVVQRYPYYKGRFIDVYGNSVYCCHSKNHPVSSMKECLEIKRGAFDSIKKMGLIAGTEEGMEGLVNELDYAEGPATPTIFRTAESGRHHPHIYDAEESTHIKKNKFSTDSRVPVWELIHHEDMLIFPYWGVSTACCPEIIDVVTLYSVLFGTAPLYSFFVCNFEKLNDVIISSYKKITAAHEKIATLPMTDFSYVTEDRKVQTTVFGDKYRIVANFSDSEYIYFEKTVAPMDFLLIEK